MAEKGGFLPLVDDDGAELPEAAMDLHACDEALALIRQFRRQGTRVLGVDGIQVTSGGRIGRLDLILDLSISPMPLEEACSRAEHFVIDHAADDIVFEVVAEGGSEQKVPESSISGSSSRGHMDGHPQNDWGSVRYDARFNEYWIEAGSARQCLFYCPWCGQELPASRRQDWFEELEAAGIDPLSDDVPLAYRSGVWRGDCAQDSQSPRSSPIPGRIIDLFGGDG